MFVFYSILPKKHIPSIKITTCWRRTPRLFRNTISSVGCRRMNPYNDACIYTWFDKLAWVHPRQWIDFEGWNVHILQCTMDISNIIYFQSLWKYTIHVQIIYFQWIKKQLNRMHIVLIIAGSLNYSQLRSGNSTLISYQIKCPCFFHKQSRITKNVTVSAAYLWKEAKPKGINLILECIDFAWKILIIRHYTE